MSKIIPQGPSPADLPAGDARREAQKAAADTLAEAAEARVEAERIDPRAFKIENEIARYFNELEVTDAQPEYEYCWVQAGYHGRFIKMKQTERVPEGGRLVPCWEVVQGDMPECQELRGMGADSTRRLGDVLLMRCRRDRFLKLKRMRDARRDALYNGTTTELEELGRQHRNRGVIVHTNLGDAMADGRGAMLRQQGLQMVDSMLRTGSVPGLGEPGSR